VTKQDGVKIVGTGLSYKLPVKRFILEVSGEITACDPSNESYFLDANINSNLTTSIEGDDTQVYLLEYQSLKAKTKTQDLTVSLNNNGLITSINSTVNDKTGPIIANIATSVFSLAQGITFPTIETFNKSGGEELSSYTPKNPCPDYLLSRLEKIKSLETEISQAKSKQQLKTKLESEIGNKIIEIEKFKAELGFYKDIKNPSRQEEAQHAYNSAIGEKNGLEQLLSNVGQVPNAEELKTKMDKLKNENSFKIVRSFIPTLESNSLEIDLSSDPDFYKKVFESDLKIIRSCLNCPSIKLTINKSSPTDPIENSNNESEQAGTSEKKKSHNGIFYRIPAMSDVEILLTQGSNATTLHKNSTPVPQYGELATLDLENRPFEETNLSVNFDENGSINKLVFKSNSQAEAASNSAKETFNGYLNFVKENEKAKIDAKAKSYELEKTNIDIAKSRSDLALTNSNNDLTTSSNSIQLLKNIQELQAAQTGNGSTDFENINKLQRENEMLNLMIENVKKQKELLELQKTLTVAP